MLNWIVWNRTVHLYKIDLALNNQQKFHKTQTNIARFTDNRFNQCSGRIVSKRPETTTQKTSLPMERNCGGIQVKHGILCWNMEIGEQYCD